VTVPTLPSSVGRIAARASADPSESTRPEAVVRLSPCGKAYTGPLSGDRWKRGDSGSGEAILRPRRTLVPPEATTSPCGLFAVATSERPSGNAVPLTPVPLSAVGSCSVATRDSPKEYQLSRRSRHSGKPTNFDQKRRQPLNQKARSRRMLPLDQPRCQKVHRKANSVQRPRKGPRAALLLRRLDRSLLP
jgi:hypothetical protein